MTVMQFTVKEGHEEEVAQYVSKVLADKVQGAKEGKFPGYEGMDCTGYGDKFAIWERYADVQTCER